MPDEEYITAAQAAQLSGLTDRQIRRLLQSKAIEGIRPGHEWLVKPSAVMAYLRQERKPGRKRSSQGKG
jgi:excisionase family DNA binding protein